MNILVVDVAAEKGGALTVLNNFYEKFSKALENNYIICTSVVEFKDTENTKILMFPWVKNSWFHRLWFDHITVKKIINHYQIDEIISLQNTLVNGGKVPQDLYLHQSLPFAEKRYSFTENYKFWIYQNVIGRMIISSVRHARKTTVQTEWMKRAIVKKSGITSDQVLVSPPKIDRNKFVPFKENKFKNCFFFPAAPLSYKNHIVLFKAAEVLCQMGERNFQILLTLTEDLLPCDCKKIYLEHKENFILKGNMEYSEVLNQYSQSVLVFPSFIETFGLPLLEGKLSGAPIIASDCAFSHEILDDYEKVKFFDPFSERQIAMLMKEEMRDINQSE